MRTVKIELLVSEIVRIAAILDQRRDYLASLENGTKTADETEALIEKILNQCANFGEDIKR